MSFVRLQMDLFAPNLVRNYIKGNTAWNDQLRQEITSPVCVTSLCSCFPCCTRIYLPPRNKTWVYIVWSTNAEKKNYRGTCKINSLQLQAFAIQAPACHQAQLLLQSVQRNIHFVDMIHLTSFRGQGGLCSQTHTLF